MAKNKFQGKEENHDIYSDFNGEHEGMIRHTLGSTKKDSKKSVTTLVLLAAPAAAILAVAVTALLSLTSVASIKSVLRSVTTNSASVEVKTDLAYSEFSYPLEYRFYQVEGFNYMTNSRGENMYPTIEEDPRPASEKYVLGNAVASGAIETADVRLNVTGLDSGTPYLLLLYESGAENLEDALDAELVVTTEGEKIDKPVATASLSPSATPSPSATASPSPTPTMTPTPTPTPTPSPSPSPSPTQTPKPTRRPTAVPTDDTYPPITDELPELPGISMSIASGGLNIEQTMDYQFVSVVANISFGGLKLSSIGSASLTSGSVKIFYDGAVAGDAVIGSATDANGDGYVDSITVFFARSSTSLEDPGYITPGTHTLSASITYVNDYYGTVSPSGSVSFTMPENAWEG